MTKKELRKLLELVASGGTPPEEAEKLIRLSPFNELDYAKPDMHRSVLKGYGEVIYCEGKTPKQLYGILKNMLENTTGSIIMTRASKEMHEAAASLCPVVYHESARIVIARPEPIEPSGPYVLIMTGGTSDQPVAEEAAIMAEALGLNVKRAYDVGVAGLYRLLSRLDDIIGAGVIIAVAGMEGALASVVAGLTDRPVIAVPTSVGYGSSMKGVAAMLTMLNSCSSGMTVVNIDNGFGAACNAAAIIRLVEEYK
ncbi:MAG: nickel pincer cofactor biosynthesis protein LarB [Christensenellales bacterium]|jgi:NCAIR mutase (PurE)-related protein